MTARLKAFQMLCLMLTCSPQLLRLSDAATPLSCEALVLLYDPSEARPQSDVSSLTLGTAFKPFNSA